MSRPIHFSIALIRRIESETTRWLVIKNPATDHWELIISQRLEKEVGSETLAREVAWRLDLDRKTDFLVGKMAMLNVEIDVEEFGADRIDFGDFEDELHTADKGSEASPTDSQSEPSRTVRVEFTPVEVYRQNTLANLDKNENVCWVSSAEICDGQFALDEFDERMKSEIESSSRLQIIDPSFVAWNRKWKIIQPWVQ